MSEGRSFILIIDAEGVADGAIVHYTLSDTGITSGDIAGGHYENLEQHNENRVFH